jgi:hypothetical protein
MATLPSTKLAYTIWLSHEKVASEMGAENSPETHCILKKKKKKLVTFYLSPLNNSAQ